jgi:hypothetical protein
MLINCSLSMDGEKFSIAKGVAKTVINTLTKQDYVNRIILPKLTNQNNFIIGTLK